MRVYRDGTFVGGVGDGVVSVSKVVPAALDGVTAGGAGLLRPGVIGYQRRIASEQYAIEALDLASGQTTVLRDKGANILRFDGGGYWASWRPDEGVVDVDGRHWPSARLLDCAHGTLVLCPDHATGEGIQFWRRGECFVDLRTGPLGADASQGPNVRRRRGVLAYQVGLQWHIFGTTQPYVPAAWPVYLVPVPLSDGRLALLERDDSRLWLRWSDDPTRGVLVATGEAHGADAVELEDGRIKVVWSTGALELPHEQWQRLVSIDEIGLEDIALPPVTIPTLSRPVWLIPYHATRHTSSVDCPGHAEIISDGHDANIRVNRRPVLADVATAPTVDDLLAVGCGADVASVGAARAVADARGVPLMAYHDYRTPFPTDLPLRRGYDWIGLMCYSEPGESIQAFVRQCYVQLEHASALGHPIALTVQMFDRNGRETDVLKLRNLQPLWAELAEAYPAVIAICPFAVLRGDHGVTAYACLTQALAAYGAAMTPPPRPSRPDLPVTPPPAPTYDPLPFLRALYRELLRRDPDEYGIDYYGTRLIDGRMTEASVRADITQSPEYRALHAPPAQSGLAGFRQAAEEAATELKGDGDAAR